MVGLQAAQMEAVRMEAARTPWFSAVVDSGGIFVRQIKTYMPRLVEGLDVRLGGHPIPIYASACPKTHVEHEERVGSQCGLHTRQRAGALH